MIKKTSVKLASHTVVFLFTSKTPAIIQPLHSYKTDKT